MITDTEIDDLIVHLNIHYGEDVPLSEEDSDLIIEALEYYKENRNRKDINKNG